MEIFILSLLAEKDINWILLKICTKFLSKFVHVIYYCFVSFHFYIAIYTKLEYKGILGNKECGASFKTEYTDSIYHNC